MSAITWLASLLWATTAATSVDVRGDARCPAPAELSAALEGLLPSRAVGAAPDVAELREREGSVSVRLLDATGDVLAERVLPEAPSCAARARAAAVVVAAWEARLRGGELGPLSVPRVERPPPPPAASIAPVVTVARSPGPPAPSRASIEVQPGAAVLASLVSGEVAAGALAEVALAPRDGRFGLGLGGLAVSTHAATVGPGQGAWRRLGGVIDARAVSRFGRAAVELRAGVALTALSVEGRSVPNAKSATIFDPGALVGLRGGWRVGPLAPWLEGTVALWPRGHNLSLTGTTQSADLPTVEVLLGIGVALFSGGG